MIKKEYAYVLSWYDTVEIECMVQIDNTNARIDPNFLMAEQVITRIRKDYPGEYRVCPTPIIDNNGLPLSFEYKLVFPTNEHLTAFLLTQ